MSATKPLWLVSTGAAVCALVLTIAPRPHIEIHKKAAGFDQPGAAAWQDLQRRMPADGSPMPDLYERASAAVSRMERFASRINRSIPASQPAARVWLGDDRVAPANLRDRVSAAGVLDAWTPLGPGNIGGRTRVVRFHPSTPTTLFAAGVSGGLWRSTDDGGSWRPIGEGLTNLNVNSLAIDPTRPDVMYAGTGEGYFREEIRGTGLPLRGGGIFATSNGGLNFQQLRSTATADFYWVNDLELGVNDPRRIYAATRTGVWRSSDAGQSWTQLMATNVRGGCLDLAVRPDRSEDVLFASCGSYEQATVYRFRSASDSNAVEIVLQEAHQGRTSLAIAASNPNVMYALAASNDGGPGGNYRQGLLAVYRSSAGGDRGSWEARTTNRDATKLHTLILTNPYGATANDCFPQLQNDFVNMGWYNNVIAVDPRDPERVWAAGVSWFRSDDGGRTWGMADYASTASTAFTHVDQHAIAFHPGYDGGANQIVMVGNDGGVFRTQNARAATETGATAPCTPNPTPSVAWTSLNRGYGVTQFYHGSGFPDGTLYIAGAQDNGTLFGRDRDGTEAWRPVFGGDGGFTAVHPTQPNTFYVELQWATLRRTTDGGTTLTVFTNGLDPVRSSTIGPEANYLFITPFTIDPNSPTRLWLGGEFLYRTTTTTWTKIGSAMPDGGVISALAVRPGQSAHLVVGTHKGDILRSRDATANTVTFATSRPRSGWVTSIAHDARTEGVVYATYGNFGGAHVYRSADYGETWQEWSGTGAGVLPDIPVHSIVVDPDDSQRLYLGTDLGVMVSVDGGRTWMTEETGFGPAVTMWLQVVKTADGAKYLFAFTHGRGAWRVRLP
jgi:hypothetical protein